MSPFNYSFRILGALHEERRLVDARTAFNAYAECDDRAECGREAYLGAFWFGGDFCQLLETTRSTKGFNGPCWSPWLWFDIDRENDIEQARRDAARLAMQLIGLAKVETDSMLIFFSGSKGFHVGLPTSLWNAEPGPSFSRQCRKFAEALAAKARVTIDVGVYDKVRAFRAPNSKHPKTGLHKRFLTSEELLGLSIDAIVKMAESPEPFEIPYDPVETAEAVALWQEAAEAVRREGEAEAVRRIEDGGKASLNRATLDFIREGATCGDRHRMLFSAAANLAEFACPPKLAFALLTEAGLDSGLKPSDVKRQIECGLNWKSPQHEEQLP